MKGKIIKMHLFYENESGWEVVEKKDTKWLFIGMSDARAPIPGGAVGSWKKVSLSGNDRDDAYLLRILENFVVQTMNETNKSG